MKTILSGHKNGLTYKKRNKIVAKEFYKIDPKSSKLNFIIFSIQILSYSYKEI
jgi:hypothetical protein